MLNLIQIYFRSINVTIGISDRVACAIDDSRIGIRGHVSLADDAIRYTTDRFCGICILVDVERAIRQSRCTLQTSSDNARIGTGYSRCNTVGMGVKAGSHTACTLGTIILFIAVTGNGRQQFIIGYFIFNRIVFDVMSLIIQRNCIGFDLCIKGTQILSGGVVYFNVILRVGWLIIVIERLARYQLVGSRSICNGSGSACSEWSCTKSLTPSVFAAVLGRCCSIRVLDRLFVLIKLYIAICICLIDLDVVTEI